MFYLKPTSAATNGNSTQYYSNTNPSNNNRVVEADSPKLQPGDIQPPHAPDTITPTLTPVVPPNNLLLPIGGSFGKVFVLVTKAALNAAVVVVEATNDNMFYNEAVDIKYYGKDVKKLAKKEDKIEDKPPTLEESAAELLDTLVEHCISDINMAVLLGESQGDSADLRSKVEPLIRRNPTIIGFIDYAAQNSSAIVHDGFSTSNLSSMSVYFLVFDGNKNNTTTTVDLEAFSGYFAEPPTPSIPPVSFGVFPTTTPSLEAYKKTVDGGGESIYRVHVWVSVRFSTTDFQGNLSSWLGVLFGLTATIKLYFPGHCHPVADPDYPMDVDNVTIDTLVSSIVSPKPPPENKYNVRVRRGYTNIGGKLQHLYTVDTTQETTVHLNYDGSNYGCKLIITAPQETAKTVNLTTAALTPNASFNNNVNGINLNTTQQTALEQCLPQPDTTLKGGFAATSNTGAALAFKSYGFESIFYKTRSPVAYNNTTLKACAIYGL